eukprot:151812_1
MAFKHHIFSYVHVSLLLWFLHVSTFENSANTHYIIHWIFVSAPKTMQQCMTLCNTCCFMFYYYDNILEITSFNTREHLYLMVIIGLLTELINIIFGLSMVIAHLFLACGWTLCQWCNYWDICNLHKTFTRQERLQVAFFDKYSKQCKIIAIIVCISCTFILSFYVKTNLAEYIGTLLTLTVFSIPYYIMPTNLKYD